MIEEIKEYVPGKEYLCGEKFTFRGRTVETIAVEHCRYCALRDSVECAAARCLGESRNDGSPVFFRVSGE